MLAPSTVQLKINFTYEIKASVAHLPIARSAGMKRARAVFGVLSIYCTTCRRRVNSRTNIQFVAKVIKTTNAIGEKKCPEMLVS
jgi:hypothetical protein